MEKLLKDIKDKLFLSPGFKRADNGSCMLYNGQANDNGYIKVTFEHPVTHKSTSSTVNRLALVLLLEQFPLPTDRDASHLCHNKTCINAEHLTLEPRALNCQRRRCKRLNVCQKHHGYPDCIFFPSECFALCVSFFIPWFCNLFTSRKHFHF